jgi:hypothetical protein
VGWWGSRRPLTDPRQARSLTLEPVPERAVDAAVPVTQAAAARKVERRSRTRAAGGSALLGSEIHQVHVAVEEWSAGAAPAGLKSP